MKSREAMLSYLEIMKSRREFEDVEDIPPLDIIVYRGMGNLQDLHFRVRTDICNLV
jgi:hypothetical protein